jgi:hypothetical protein
MCLICAVATEQKETAGVVDVDPRAAREAELAAQRSQRVAASRAGSRRALTGAYLGDSWHATLRVA